MRYTLRLDVVPEGKTTIKVRAEVENDQSVVAVADGKAQSVSRAVTLALEGLWDALLARSVVEAREELRGGRKERPDEPAGLLPDSAPVPPILFAEG